MLHLCFLKLVDIPIELIYTIYHPNIDDDLREYMNK